MEATMSILSHRFSCVECAVYTNHKKDYNKHLLTAKHYKLTNGNKELTDFVPNLAFTCKHCSKKYTSRAGLWKHNKICIKPNEAMDTNDLVILTLVKQNEELQKLIVKLSSPN
jgi:hypothetical protein